MTLFCLVIDTVVNAKSMSPDVALTPSGPFRLLLIRFSCSTLGLLSFYSFSSRPRQISSLPFSLRKSIQLSLKPSATRRELGLLCREALSQPEGGVVSLRRRSSANGRDHTRLECLPLKQLRGNYGFVWICSQPAVSIVHLLLHDNGVHPRKQYMSIHESDTCPSTTALQK